MPDLHPSEDKAAQYVLGGLTTAERREFEAELAQSAELRALVRELEESSVLLARSSPQRRPPPKVWQAIEKTVAAEAKPKIIPAFWTAWWRQGWAAAAACLLGWLLYAFWVNRPAAVNSTANDSSSQTETNLAENSHKKNREAQPPYSNKNDFAQPIISVDARELARLRHQTMELQSNVTRLSQAVAQQQALLGESNRIKFFQITPSSASNANVPPAPLSPALQRAIFVAMNRELGWLPSPDASAPTDPANPVLQSGQLNASNIDFLDLRTATNGAPNLSQPQPNNQAASHSTPDTSPAVNNASIAIPAFTSGNNVIVAIDQSIVPVGTQLNVLNQDQQTIGTTTLGYNPIVITIPTSSDGSPVYLTTGIAGGYTNIFQFFNASGPTP